MPLLLLAALLLLNQTELEQEQIFEHESLASERKMILRGGIVQVLVHLVEWRKRLPDIVREELAGIGQPVHQLFFRGIERITAQFPQRLLSHALGQGVDGDQPARRKPLAADSLPFGISELQAAIAGLEAAADDNLITLGELLGDPRREPDNPDRSSAVEETGLHARRADTDFPHLNNLAPQRDLSPKSKRIIQPDRVGVIDMAAGHHPEHVLKGLQPEPLLKLLDVFRTNTRQLGDRCIWRKLANCHNPVRRALLRGVSGTFFSKRAIELSVLRGWCASAKERLDCLEMLAYLLDLIAAGCFPGGELHERRNRRLKGCGDFMRARDLGQQLAERIDGHGDIASDVRSTHPNAA